jgi:hypothetical protein
MAFLDDNNGDPLLAFDPDFFDASWLGSHIDSFEWLG